MFHVAPHPLHRPRGLAVRGSAAAAALTAVRGPGAGRTARHGALGEPVNDRLLSDSFALIPLLRLTHETGGWRAGRPRPARAGPVGAGLLFAVAAPAVRRPRRARRGDRLPPRFVGGHVPVRPVPGGRRPRRQPVSPTRPGSTTQSERSRARLSSTRPRSLNPHILWQTEFWNRAVGPIYQVETDAPANPGSAATIQPATGRVLVDDPRGRFPPEYAVADADAQVVGDVVARRGALALTRSESPAPSRRSHRRSPRRRLDGRRGFVQLLRRERRHRARAAVRVSLSRARWRGPDKPGDVRIRVGRINPRSAAAPPSSDGEDRRSARWVIHSGGARTFAVPGAAAAVPRELRISPTFSPAEYGLPDARQLGAQVSFETQPSGS